MALPNGIVTFLFSDIEGSTRLLERYPRAYPVALARHDLILRAAIESHAGAVFETVGDAFYAAFARPADAIEAALQVQQDLQAEPWVDTDPIAVRMALHTGEVEQRGDHYFGPALYRCARLMSLGHGGQVLVSGLTASLVRDALPSSISVRDLGSYRLKDLAVPEQAWQLIGPWLPDRFPALRAGQPMNNLPIQLTKLIGRQHELAQIRAKLVESRLVTLVGPGGTGKTRLALDVAAASAGNFPDGIWFGDLTACNDPTLVARSVAGTLGIKERPGTDVLQAILDQVRGDRLLLVLDNCEHVVGACATVAEALLHACPNARMLATSREALRVSGEITYTIDGLSLPMPTVATVEELLASEAAQLFVERASAGSRSFRLTDELVPATASICRRLDGLPLAIELAAARVRAMGVRQVAARLERPLQLLTAGSRTATPRQRTLRGAIDWSYNLLEQPEQLLFDRLAVFTGGWTIEAAETVCSGGDVRPDDVLDLLERLLNRSMVLVDLGESVSPRYRMLETLREYSSDHLADLPDAAAIHAAHALYFADLAELAEPQLVRPAQAEWFETLEREHENIRAALRWCLDSGEADTGLRLGGAMRRFWQVRGYLNEGEYWLSQLADLTTDQRPSLARANILHGIGLLAGIRGEHARAAAFLEDSLDLRRQLDDRRGIPRLLNNLGGVATARGDYVSARDWYQQSLDLWTELADDRGVGLALLNLGILDQFQGNYDESEPLVQRAVVFLGRAGDRDSTGRALLALSINAQQRGDDVAALTTFEQSLRLFVELGDKEEIVECLEVAAGLVAAIGESKRAARLFGAAQALMDRIGLAPPATARLHYVSDLELVRASLGPECFERAWTAGRGLSMDQAVVATLESLDAAKRAVPASAR